MPGGEKIIPAINRIVDRFENIVLSRTAIRQTMSLLHPTTRISTPMIQSN